jgi:hypothetical protein
LVVEGVGRTEGETAVKSGEGDVALQTEGREPYFEICLGDGTAGDEEETGEGVIEGRL